ncbi:MAG: DUF3368 domain-containing protein [Acidobacteriota bacterium]
MSSAPIVADASALIALHQIDHLDLLEQLFQRIVIPPAVTREIAPSVSLPAWIDQRGLSQPIGAQILAASLGAGESESISLALETDAKWVILDDRPARRLAQALRIPTVGTLGILVAAKRRGLISAVRPCLEALLRHDFRMAPMLYDRVLKDVGEADSAKPRAEG